jgi:alcohol dehydrogenase
MRALRLFADRDLRIVDQPAPPAPAAGEAQLSMKAVALNHIDVWGYRGMVFARRTLPITVGVEGVGEVAAVGAGVTAIRPGDRVVVYGGLYCGQCRACRSGRENLCESVGGILGFHVDGLAAETINVPERLLIKVPDGVDWTDAACAPVTFATVQHMLFDNAKLEQGETILVHAAGSGVGSIAILMAKQIGATVIATAGSDEKVARARVIGADHAVNYREQRFETVARRLTAKRGVDVVFEHVGPDTWPGSLLALARGGRLVTCGSTTGVSAPTNLMHLYQQQIRIIASFGASIRNVREGLAKMAAGLKPVIDSTVTLDEIEPALKRMEGRDVFGKIVVQIG